MISFEEYIARRQGGDPLGTPAEMLARAGIWPTVPNEVVIKRMVKRWGKQKPPPAATRSTAEIVSASRLRRPRSGPPTM